MRSVLLLTAVCGALAASGNMNGKYSVTSVDTLDATWNDDYKSKGHEYFDVWAPEIASTYGQVFWTSQGNVPLPPDIVKRFEGKVMAITGYEQDQVMVTPVGQPGVNPDKDVSVPINWAYNHHYMAWMTGKHSTMEEVKITDKDELWENHGKDTKMVAVELPGPRNFADVAPTSQMFSEGNGGESRKSFHGYPDGFAQLIESPNSWHITPMQIDTRNRDCGVGPESVKNCSEQFHPWIEPKQARYGRMWAGTDGAIPVGQTNYSGVLECPCNSAYGGDPMIYPGTKTKIDVDKYTALPSGSCAAGKAVKDAADCFAQMTKVGVYATSFTNKTVSDKTMPAGCSVVTNADGTATAYFNTAGAMACPTQTTKVAEVKTDINVTMKIALSTSGDQKPAMVRSKKGVYCSDNHQGVLQSFVAKSSSADDQAAALAACEAFCLTNAQCTACSVDQIDKASDKNQWVAIPECGSQSTWPGSIAGDISMKGSASPGTATITLTGPADKWFGVGLNAQVMSDKPYTFIVNASGVIEQKLGTCGSEADHCPGDQLSKSITLKSNNVENGVRTVVVTRPYKGATANHYTFTPDSVASINIITAVGKDQIFAYHTMHEPSMLTFTTTGQHTCICNDGGAGQICGAGGVSCGHFTKNCVHSDGKGMGGDLFDQHNPTCNSAQYSGGLSCCHHGRIMLDTDQIKKYSTSRAKLRYHMKFRFWFQEYKPSGSAVVPKGTTKSNTTTASHFDLPRIYFQTEANAGEYDIPPAFATKEHPLIPGYPGHPISSSKDDLHLTPGSSCTGNCPYGDDCDCVHTITYNHTVSNMRLIYAGGHCHAPACIGIWLYRNDPGHEMELLCHQHPVYGNGHGNNTISGIYDEAGYLSLPPCLWGDDEGLHPSVLLPPGTPLISIKKNHNTKTGHYGEMASWQMRGVNF